MNDLAKIEPATGRWSVADIQIMAEQVAKSRLFGLDAAQAFTLMCLCEAEGIHPIKAVQRYHVIQGRPSMKADAMLADFLRIGGTVTWSTESDDKEKCEAIFTHPKFAPDGKTVRFSVADAKAAGLTGNPTWQKFPSNMLRARVTSTAIRMLAPGIVAGLYTPEEVEDFDPPARNPATRGKHATIQDAIATLPPPPTQFYSEWLAEFCEDINRRWLDWTLEHRDELKGKVPAEIVTTKMLQPGDKAATEEAWLNTPAAVQEEHTSEARRIWTKAVRKYRVQPLSKECRSKEAELQTELRRQLDELKPARDPGCDDERTEDEIMDAISIELVNDDAV